MYLSYLSHQIGKQLKTFDRIPICFARIVAVHYHVLPTPVQVFPFPRAYSNAVIFRVPLLSHVPLPTEAIAFYALVLSFRDPLI